jgi:glycosyltransferase involved in cell wall biosynthesis
MQALLSQAYVYVLPSEIEGLSTGLIEAMCYGNCVLVSDIEENLEGVEDCGISFKSGDVEDLSRKLRELMADPERVQGYRLRAKAYAWANYDWDRTTDEFERLYQSLVGPGV